MNDDTPTPSRTSQAVAVTRAQFVRPTTPGGDDDAQQRLCQGMPVAVLQDRVPSLRARTTFFDDAVLAAISGGTRQIVILGAGYDDRALRFRSPGVHFIEIDHPATQNDKARRLQAITETDAQPTLAPADFGHDDVNAVLERAGHDSDAPTLFVGEGLLAYLDQDTIIGLMTRLRARAGPRSRLVVSLAVHPAGIASERVITAANALRRTGATEPWLTILPADEHLSLLTRAGWHVERTLDQVELEPDAPPGTSVFVSARTVEQATRRVEQAGRRVEHVKRHAAKAAKKAEALERIADAEGFGAVSMRRIATELGAGTMTLYHYVRTKDDLLTLVTDAVRGEVVVPLDEPIPGDWRAAMTVLAERTRAAMQRHPWILDITDDPAIGPNSVRHFDQSLEAVAALSVSLTEKLDIVGMVDEYVFGYCLQVRNNTQPEEVAFDDAMITYVNGLLQTGDDPHLAAMADEVGIDTAWRQIEAHTRDTTRFARNLNRLFDGIEASLPSQ